MATTITVTEDVTKVTVTETTTELNITPQVTTVGVSAVDITASNIAQSVSLNPTGGISATNVQAGFAEVASEAAFLSGANFTGNVGMDVADPQQKLDINGNIRVRGTYPKIEFVDTNHNPDFTLIGGNGAVQFYDETNSASRLYVGSNEVGIGTSSPDNVGSATTVHINDNTNGVAIRLSQDTNNAFVSYDDTNGMRIQSIDKIALKTNNTERMTVDADGKVGIGTDDPQTTLDVNGTATFNDTVTIPHGVLLDFESGSVYNALNLRNNNIISVNNIKMNDSGTNEGVQWANWRIFESPIPLANENGNFQITYTGGGGNQSILEVRPDGISVTGNVILSGTVDGRDVATDGAKLDGIEALATADQTDLEIKTAYENNANTNAFTDDDSTKLNGIEASADVTDATNVASAGAVMDSDFASSGFMKRGDNSGSYDVASSIGFADLNCVKDEDDMASDSATHIPTQQSVAAYVKDLIADQEKVCAYYKNPSQMYSLSTAFLTPFNEFETPSYTEKRLHELDYSFHLKSTTSALSNQVYVNVEVEVPTGGTAYSLGNATRSGSGDATYNDVLSIDGDVSDKVSAYGSLALSANPSGQYSSRNIYRMYYDRGDDKTYIQYSAFPQGLVLDSDDPVEIFHDPFKFNNAGSWITIVQYAINVYGSLQDTVQNIHARLGYVQQGFKYRVRMRESNSGDHLQIFDISSRQKTRKV